MLPKNRIRVLRKTFIGIAGLIVLSACKPPAAENSDTDGLTATSRNWLTGQTINHYMFSLFKNDNTANGAQHCWYYKEVDQSKKKIKLRDALRTAVLLNPETGVIKKENGRYVTARDPKTGENLPVLQKDPRTGAVLRLPRAVSIQEINNAFKGEIASSAFWGVVFGSGKASCAFAVNPASWAGPQAVGGAIATGLCVSSVVGAFQTKDSIERNAGALANSGNALGTKMRPVDVSVIKRIKEAVQNAESKNWDNRIQCPKSNVVIDSIPANNIPNIDA